MSLFPVSDMSGIAARLDAAGIRLVDASNAIAYQSRGKIFVAVDGGELMLKKHYQPYRGAPVEQVVITPRDLKNVCVWLNGYARDRGVHLGLHCQGAL